MFRAFPRVAAVGATAAVASASNSVAAEALHSPAHLSHGVWDTTRSRFIREPDEAEEWDLCEVEEISRSRVINLGPVPTKAEAEAAARELLQGAPSRAFDDHSEVEEIVRSSPAPAGGAPFSEALPRPPQAAADAALREAGVVRAGEGPLQHAQLSAGGQGGLATRMAGSQGADVVMRAFRTYERDPDMQEAVTALVQDPNIWAAIHQNPSVRAILLRRSVPSIAPADAINEEDPLHAAADGASALASAHPDPVGNLVRLVAAQLKSLVVRMDGFFAWLKKTILGGDAPGGSDVDPNTLVGVLVLVIAVVAVIIFKRPISA